MSEKTRTMTDWPIGTKGNTLDGREYEIIHHSTVGTILAIVYEIRAVWYTGNGEHASNGMANLVHHDDEGIHLTNLSNPDMVTFGKLDRDSRDALQELRENGELEFHNKVKWVLLVAENAKCAHDIVYRRKPELKFRHMTQDECKAWAMSQPDTVWVLYDNRPYRASALAYGSHVYSDYKWADVQQGGGWQPLPMVEVDK